MVSVRTPSTSAWWPKSRRRIRAKAVRKGQIRCLCSERKRSRPFPRLCPTVVGYGLYFFTYSTWKGRNIYMEDLYVRPEFRGQGIGKKLMSRIAQMGVEKGCTQMKFSVLDWNRPAVDFYRSKGAVDLTAAEDWHVFRFEADALRRLALGEPGE
uniref:Thialysine N-epsilon-acetyltransferase-like isoform X2 n=1 Tax=Pogona vitticeps TaxID=103695 RepID=A0ABM5EJK2_9SAUR